MEYEDAINEQHELKSKIVALNGIISNHEKVVSENEKLLFSERNKHSMSLQHLDDVEYECGLLTKDIDERNVSIKHKDETIAELKYAITKLNNTIADNSELLDEVVNSRIEDKTKQLEELHVKYKDERDANAFLNTELQKCKTENLDQDDEIKVKYNTLTMKLNKVQDYNDELSTKIFNLEESETSSQILIDNLKTENANLVEFTNELRESKNASFNVSYTHGENLGDVFEFEWKSKIEELERELENSNLKLTQVDKAKSDEELKFNSEIKNITELLSSNQNELEILNLKYKKEKESDELTMKSLTENHNNTLNSLKSEINEKKLEKEIYMKKHDKMEKEYEIKIENMNKAVENITTSLKDSNLEIKQLVERTQFMEGKIEILKEDKEFNQNKIATLTEEIKTHMFKMSTTENELITSKDLCKNLSSKLETELSVNDNITITMDILSKELIQSKSLYEESVVSQKCIKDDMNSKIGELEESHKTILEEIKIKHTYDIKTKNNDLDSVSTKLENSNKIILNLENRISEQDNDITKINSDNVLLTDLSVANQKSIYDNLEKFTTMELENRDNIEDLNHNHNENIKSIQDVLVTVEKEKRIVVESLQKCKEDIDYKEKSNEKQVEEIENLKLKIKDLTDSNENVCSKLGEEIKIEKERNTSKLESIKKECAMKIDIVHKQRDVVSNSLENSNSEIKQLVEQKKFMEGKIDILNEDKEFNQNKISTLTEENKTRMIKMSTTETELIMLKDSFKNMSKKLESEVSENKNLQTSMTILNKELVEKKIIYEESIANKTNIIDEINSKISEFQVSRNTDIKEIKIKHSLHIETKNNEFVSITKKLDDSNIIILNLENRISEQDDDIKQIFSDNIMLNELSVANQKSIDDNLEKFTTMELENRENIEALNHNHNEDIKSIKNEVFKVKEEKRIVVESMQTCKEDIDYIEKSNEKQVEEIENFKVKIKDLVNSNEKVCSNLCNEIKIEKEKNISKLDIIENHEIKIGDLHEEYKVISHSLEKRNSEIKQLIERKQFMEGQIEVLKEDKEFNQNKIYELTDENKMHISKMSTTETELFMLKDSFKNMSYKLENELSINDNNKISIDTLNKQLVENKIIHEESIESQKCIKDEMNSKIGELKSSHNTILEKIKIKHNLDIETKNNEFDTIATKLENSNTIITDLESSIISKNKEITKIYIDSSLIKDTSEKNLTETVSRLQVEHSENIDCLKNDLCKCEEEKRISNAELFNTKNDNETKDALIEKYIKEIQVKELECHETVKMCNESTSKYKDKMNSMKQFYSNTTDETDVKFNKINDLYNEKSLKLRITTEENNEMRADLSESRALMELHEGEVMSLNANISNLDGIRKQLNSRILTLEAEVDYASRNLRRDNQAMAATSKAESLASRRQTVSSSTIIAARPVAARPVPDHKYPLRRQSIRHTSVGDGPLLTKEQLRRQTFCVPRRPAHSVSDSAMNTRSAAVKRRYESKESFAQLSSDRDSFNTSPFSLASSSFGDDLPLEKETKSPKKFLNKAHSMHSIIGTDWPTEEDEFDDRFAPPINHPSANFGIGSGDAPPYAATMDGADDRSTELSRRNRLQLPHLKSSYPAERLRLRSTISAAAVNGSETTVIAGSASSNTNVHSVKSANTTSRTMLISTDSLDEDEDSECSVSPKKKASIQGGVSKIWSRRFSFRRDPRLNTKSTDKQIKENEKPKKSVAFEIGNTPTKTTKKVFPRKSSRLTNIKETK